jgi:hypothetical protein
MQPHSLRAPTSLHSAHVSTAFKKRHIEDDPAEKSNANSPLTDLYKGTLYKALINLRAKKNSWQHCWPLSWMHNSPFPVSHGFLFENQGSGIRRSARKKQTISGFLYTSFFPIRNG